MEIEFNTGPVGKPDPGQPVSRKERVQPVREGSFEKTDALEQKLKDISLSRPEEVARVKSLVSNLKYPPDEMLDGIANLLAMKIK